MLGVFVGLCLASVAYGVHLEAGKPYVYSVTGYPDLKYKPGQDSFEFDANPGYRIITYCSDFRLLRTDGSPCDEFEMKISDGTSEKKFCNNHDRVMFKSEGSKLKVEMKYKLGGLVSCVARSTEAPEATEITVGPESEERIESPEERVPYFDKVWLFKSQNNEKIKISCYLGMRQSDDCVRESFSIEDEEQHFFACDSRTEEFVSYGNSVKVRAIFDEHGNARFSCYAKIDKEEKPFVPPPTPDVSEKNKKDEESFTLKAGEERQFGIDENRYENWEGKFTITTNPKAPVHVYCSYIYSSPEPGQDPCQHMEINVSDGVSNQKICPEGRMVNYFSKGSTVVFNVNYKRSVPLKCIAISSAPVVNNEVALDVSDGVYSIEEKSKHEVPYNSAWKIVGKETKVSLQCDISTSSHENQTVCMGDVIRVDTGDGNVDISCGAKKLVYFSKDKTITFQAQFEKDSSGDFFCKAQAVTGPHPDEHNNLVIPQSAEDAGDTPGSKSTSCQCGRRNHVKQNRIFGGNDTKEGEFPWIAGIRDHSNGQRCTASIITQYHILTAAHCMVDSKTRKKDEITPTVVYVGAHSVQSDSSHQKTKGYVVKETFIPEEWWQFKKAYDIAVLYLEEKIAFSQWVQPVCLSSIAPRSVNRAAKSLGWGLSENGYPEFLLTTKLFVLSRSHCGNQDAIICTHNKNSSVCYGDSGGPLSVIDPETNRYTQIGVASYVNYPYCESSSGYSNVTYHYGYIQDVIKKTMPSAKTCEKV